MNYQLLRLTSQQILIKRYSLDKNDGNTQAIIKECMPMWDGGFVLCGMTGTGKTFAARDPWGIRTAFYYADDEIIVIAS